jgi:hypothetical protein
MPDATMIAGAIESAKAVLGLAKVATSAVVDHQVKEKLIEIQQAILDVQQKLGDAHSERMELLEQVADLRARLRTASEQRAKLDDYEMAAMTHGLVVYRPKEGKGTGVEHLACPSCYTCGKVSILVVMRTGRVQHQYKCMDMACSYVAYDGLSDPRTVRTIGHL